VIRSSWRNRALYAVEGLGIVAGQAVAQVIVARWPLAWPTWSA
jgi:hypothetical protein